MTIRRTTRSLALSAFVAPVLMMSATHGAAASLSENKTINDGLFAIAAADEIRKTCPSIDARMLKALGFLNSLGSHARQQGYSKREIDDFVDSKADKKRLEKRAADYRREKIPLGTPVRAVIFIKFPPHERFTDVDFSHTTVILNSFQDPW